MPKTFDLTQENLNAETFDSIAKDWAVSMKTTNRQGQEVEGVKKTQARKFYDEIIMWDEIVNSEEQFKEQLPFICMMKSKAEYALSRSLITSTFKDMIDKLVDQVKTPGAVGGKKVLHRAKLFFEAFMGFFKGCN